MEALAESYHYELAGQGIESSVIEPGAYQTAVFGNMVTAADYVRLETYGAAAQIPDKVNAVLTASMANAQDIAEAVLNVIETAPGQRQLRYRVSPTDLGVDAINNVCSQVQSQVLSAFGLTADTTFTQRSSASAD
jgi:NAD(P)-dependent dehydrogenase (short-subunit alcohol dehydrogenase family)